MPTVYIWYPDKDHPYGHAALQTAKYHISFWPDGDTSELGKTRAVLKGVPGSLHFHHELDRYCEGNRLPTGIYKILYATDEAINRIYEEFLQYNGIDPADVTLEAGEKLVRQNKRPEVSVSLTKYAFVPDQAIDYSLKFYTHENNCVSTCCNMILTANPKSFLNKILLGMFDVVTLQIFDVFSVPWFESYIKKHWVEGSGWNMLNVFDNAITRSARYWVWYRWTNNSQTEQKPGFQDLPVDFKAVASKTNKKQQ